MTPYLTRYYAAVASVWDVLVRAGSLGAFPALHAAAAERLQLRPGAKVLDVGCGTGLMFEHLVHAVGETGAVIGLDASPAMLAAARRRVQRRGWRNVELCHATAESFELPHGLDGVVFAISLSAFPHCEDILRRYAGALAPHGRLVVVDAFVDGGAGTSRLASAYTRIKAWVVGSRVQNRIRETAGEVLSEVRLETVHRGLYSIISGSAASKGALV